jgi:hypothetical protein
MVPEASPDQSLVDANITQHLPPYGIMWDVLRHLYSRSRAYKGECRSRLALSQLHHLQEARAPVKNKKEQQKADHSIHCEQEAILHFPAKICCALPVQLTSSSTGRGCLNLDNERKYLIQQFLRPFCCWHSLIQLSRVLLLTMLLPMLFLLLTSHESLLWLMHRV